MEGGSTATGGLDTSVVETAVSAGLGCWASTLRIDTAAPVVVLDLTPRIDEFLASTHLEQGWVSVQTRHTTCGLAVNEHETRLLADLVALLERLAPRQAAYAHDALHLRRDVPPEERPNGHAHAKALLLRTTESLHVARGRLQLGRWQRLLLLELDGPREREISLLALGTARR